MGTYSSAQLARAFFKLKKNIAELEAKHKQELADPKEDLASVEQMLLEALHEEGIKSVKVEGGTFGLSERTVYKAADINEARAFALENNWTELLKMDIAQAGVKAYMEANDGALPPGIEEIKIDTAYNRPSKK